MSEIKFGTNNENIIVNSDTSSSDQAYNNETSDSDEEEEIPLELLKQMMGVQIGSTSTPVTYKTNLEEVTVEGIAKAIKQGKCKNIIVMSGAGISVSAGIPDFRTPGTGLYDNLQKYNLPHATAVFEIDYFRQRPDPFYLLAKELFPGNFKPTPTHYFVKLLEKKGILLRNYTQNIDTLERVAGISGDKLVEAHGSFATSHCIDCNKEETTEAVKKHVENGTIPHCSACGGLVKPDIVFFGESLPSRFFQLLNDDFAKCDLLLVLGTSLQVQPFASLIGKVPNECPRLLINRELVGTIDKKYGELLANSPSKFLSFIYYYYSSFFFVFNTNYFYLEYFRFDMESNYRDVALLGDCDSGVLKLADLCGWKQELDLLINSPSTNNNTSL